MPASITKWMEKLLRGKQTTLKEGDFSKLT
jgi:hypothetical protein